MTTRAAATVEIPSDRGALPTQGAYDEVVVINALALRNTSYNYGAWLDCRGWRAMAIQVINGLDQAVALNIQYGFAADGSNSDEYYDSGATAAVAGSVRLWTGGGANGARVTVVTALNPILAPYLHIGVKASVAPTSGSVTVKAYRLA